MKKEQTKGKCFNCGRYAELDEGQLCMACRILKEQGYNIPEFTSSTNLPVPIVGFIIGAILGAFVGFCLTPVEKISISSLSLYALISGIAGGIIGILKENDSIEIDLILKSSGIGTIVGGFHRNCSPCDLRHGR